MPSHPDSNTCGSYCLVCYPQAGTQDLSLCVCTDLKRCPVPPEPPDFPHPLAICGIINQTPDGGEDGGGCFFGGGSGWGGDFEHGGETNPQPPGAFASLEDEGCTVPLLQGTSMPTPPQAPNKFTTPVIKKKFIQGTRLNINTTLPFSDNQTFPSIPLNNFLLLKSLLNMPLLLLH